jgi:cytolysin-activating lysine-acyltransferase
MKFGTLDVLAPGLITPESLGSGILTTGLAQSAQAHPDQSNVTWTEAEVLGSTAWLWMHSQKHREIPLHVLSTLLLPAIKHQQFILISEHGKPIFYLSWANLSAEAEARYIKNPAYAMPQEDWNSGDRMWILDWVAPFGHTKVVSRLLEQRLFTNRWMRSLYHRGNDRGLRVKTFHGIGVMSDEARFWFETHPFALHQV